MSMPMTPFPATMCRFKALTYGYIMTGATWGGGGAGHVHSLWGSHGFPPFIIYTLHNLSVVGLCLRATNWFVAWISLTAVSRACFINYTTVHIYTPVDGCVKDDLFWVVRCVGVAGEVLKHVISHLLYNILQTRHTISKLLQVAMRRLAQTGRMG